MNILHCDLLTPPGEGVATLTGVGLGPCFLFDTSMGFP